MLFERYNNYLTVLLIMKLHKYGCLLFWHSNNAASAPALCFLSTSTVCIASSNVQYKIKPKAVTGSRSFVPNRDVNFTMLLTLACIFGCAYIYSHWMLSCQRKWHLLFVFSCWFTTKLWQQPTSWCCTTSEVVWPNRLEHSDRHTRVIPCILLCLCIQLDSFSICMTSSSTGYIQLLRLTHPKTITYKSILYDMWRV